jgi:S-adenosylmethionine hydrolase
VGPDNGLFSFVIQNAAAQGLPLQAVVLDRPEFWLPEVSHSFHGRDLFAPVAAHLAQGWRFSDIGSPLLEPVRLSFPLPQPVSDGWRGEIITIDHFGNLITNLSPNHIPAGEGVSITVGESIVRGISRTFGEHDPGELIAMLDSSGYLSIAVVNGNAASRLNAHIGDAVLLTTGLSQRTPEG